MITSKTSFDSTHTQLSARHCATVRFARMALSGIACLLLSDLLSSSGGSGWISSVSFAQESSAPSGQEAAPPAAEQAASVPAPEAAATSVNSAGAQENAATLSAATGLIDFNRDVRPILESSCIECHGPKVAKEGFRADEKDTLLSYVTPGDAAGSSLWSDYLVAEDEEMKMPPVAHNKPLTGAQLATIKLWIEEGAAWSDAVATTKTVTAAPKTQFQRITRVLGLFHPAAVHFPVALLLISAFFVICSFVHRDAFEGAAFHCLWIGALSACASSAMGWFFAESRGYPSVPTFDFSSDVERHRWTAISLSVLALATIPIAIASRRKPENRGRRIVWLAGAGLLSVLVSIAGHQGGEMVYGEDLYTPAFTELFGSDEAQATTTTDVSASKAEAPSEPATPPTSDAK